MRASSQTVAHDPSKANDGQIFTSWTPDDSEAPWLGIDFGAPTAINEFKIKEHESSSITRYVIEYWDEKQKRWLSCFNGMEIGPEFAAPIVNRTTEKVRLRVLNTKRGVPSISEFEAFGDPAGTPFADPTGAEAVKIVGE